MSVTQIDVPPDLERAGRSFGYGIAIAINVAMLIIVQYILDWGWLAFLTDEFADVVPWISLGLAATIVANLVYQFNDTRIVKSTGQILTNLISIFVTLQIYRVFPFDFSGSSFDWEVIFRILLILAMVGAGVGVLVEAVKLASSELQQERRRRMQTTSNSVQSEVQAETRNDRRLYRSNTQRVVAGVCGGLGEYFAVDPVWFRIGFVVLALGGGSGILIYLVMWLVIQPAPNGYVSSPIGRGSLTGAAVVGVVFMILGTIALVNTVAPWMGQYIWPVVFVLGGLALVMGGLNRDNH